MNRNESAEYLDAAARLDTQIAREFGYFADTPPEDALPLIPIDKATNSIVNPHNTESSFISVANNITILRQPAYAGQTVGWLRQEGLCPAILEGPSTDGGLRLTWLHDMMSLRDPYITTQQDILLRAAQRLHGAEVGHESADTSGATAAEPGHTYMGLKAVTDPSVVQAIQQGRHVVHGWTDEGITETVTRRSAQQPGMFDTRLASGEWRRPSVSQVVLSPTDTTMLLYHPDFPGKAHYEVGLAPERLALGVGIVAARSIKETTETRVRDELFPLLERVNRV